MTDASRPDGKTTARPPGKGADAPKPDPSSRDKQDAERQARAKDKAAKDRNEDG